MSASAQSRPVLHRNSFGLTSSVYFLGNSLGPLTGGIVGATIGLHWVFLVTAALLAMSAAWVYRGVRA